MNPVKGIDCTFQLFSIYVRCSLIRLTSSTKAFRPPFIPNGHNRESNAPEQIPKELSWKRSSLCRIINSFLRLTSNKPLHMFFISSKRGMLMESMELLGA